MEDTMSIEKVMEILDEFEVKAAKDIELDRAIKADSYESFGRYKLIRKIKKRINEVTATDHKERRTNQCRK
jgi:hypothetical protein